MSAATFQSDSLIAEADHLPPPWRIDSKGETLEAEESEGISHPLLWGFVVTLFLGIIGYFGLLVSRNLWPLLWLPLLSPLFGLLYLIFFVHNTKGLSRFLAGFGISLVAIMAVGILLVLALYYGVLV